MLKLAILVVVLLCFNHAEANNDKQIQANAACVGMSVIKEAMGHMKAIPRSCSKDSMQTCNDVCNAERTIPSGYGGNSKFSSNSFHMSFLLKNAYR